MSSPVQSHQALMDAAVAASIRHPSSPPPSGSVRAVGAEPDTAFDEDGWELVDSDLPTHDIPFTSLVTSSEHKARQDAEFKQARDARDAAGHAIAKVKQDLETIKRTAPKKFFFGKAAPHERRAHAEASLRALDSSAQHLARALATHQQSKTKAQLDALVATVKKQTTQQRQKLLEAITDHESAARRKVEDSGRFFADASKKDAAARAAAAKKDAAARAAAAKKTGVTIGSPINGGGRRHTRKAARKRRTVKKRQNKKHRSTKRRSPYARRQRKTLRRRSN